MSKLVTTSDYAEDYFYFNRWLLERAGLWTPTFRNVFLKYLYQIYAVVVFLFVNLWFTATELISIKDTYANSDFLIKNINFSLTHIMGGIKCVFWYFKGDELVAIMNTLESDTYHYENIKNFNPGLVTRKAKTTGFRYSFCFFVLAHMTIISSYAPMLFTALYNPSYIETEDGNKTLNMRMPYFSWIPFAYHTPSWYIFALFYQMGPMFSYAYSIVGMDSLFMNIMNFIGAHMIILHGAFKTIRERSLANLKGPQLTPMKLHNSPKLNEEMWKKLIKSIRHLQCVIKY